MRSAAAAAVLRSARWQGNNNRPALGAVASSSLSSSSSAPPPVSHHSSPPSRSRRPLHSLAAAGGPPPSLSPSAADPAAAQQRRRPRHLPRHRRQQRRSIVSALRLVNSALIGTAPSEDSGLLSDVEFAVDSVRTYDPAGYLPGLLLPSPEVRLGYYAVRSFWVQTGLRMSPLPDFGAVPTEDGAPGSGSGNGATTTTSSGGGWATDDSVQRREEERMRRWRHGIDSVYGTVAPPEEEGHEEWRRHPTLRLLRHVVEYHSPLSRRYFDSILDARLREVYVKQYETMDELVHHAGQSCGSLLQLVMEIADVPHAISGSDDGGGDGAPSQAYLAAGEVGVAHGLSNALRTSVPVLSTTGRIVVPADLCVRHGVRSPRFLLSALGMGDDECRRAMQGAVGDIVGEARDHLASARGRRDGVAVGEKGAAAAAVLLPGLASETFLDRLEGKGFDLTDRDLRLVGVSEHAACASKLVKAWWNKSY